MKPPRQKAQVSLTSTSGAAGQTYKPVSEGKTAHDDKDGVMERLYKVKSISI